MDNSTLGGILIKVIFLLILGAILIGLYFMLRKRRQRRQSTRGPTIPPSPIPIIRLSALQKQDEVREQN
jgi:hypothetical protein